MILYYDLIKVTS